MAKTRKTPASDKQFYLCALLGIKVRSDASREHIWKLLDDRSKAAGIKGMVIFVNSNKVPMRNLKTGKWE